MSAIDEMMDDLGWRESELAALKLVLHGTNEGSVQRSVMLRASWAMLYAHYEGFSKFCLITFYDEASKRLSDCKDLPSNTLAFAASSHLKKMRKLPSLELIGNIRSFTKYLESTLPSFPEVDTRSNLRAKVLRELLADADIDSQFVEDASIEIATLVDRRNNIAHGQRDIVLDVGYYLGFEKVVYDLMYGLALSVDRRLGEQPYSTSGASSN